MKAELFITRDDGTLIVQCLFSPLAPFQWSAPRSIGPVVEGEKALIAFTFDPIVVDKEVLK